MMQAIDRTCTIDTTAFVRSCRWRCSWVSRNVVPLIDLPPRGFRVYNRGRTVVWTATQDGIIACRDHEDFLVSYILLTSASIHPSVYGSIKLHLTS